MVWIQACNFCAREGEIREGGEGRNEEEEGGREGGREREGGEGEREEEGGGEEGRGGGEKGRRGSVKVKEIKREREDQGRSRERDETPSILPIN